MVSTYTPLCTSVRSQFTCHLHRETFPDSSKSGWVAPSFAPMGRYTCLCSTWVANVYSTLSAWCVSIYAAHIFWFNHYLTAKLSNLPKTSHLSSGLSRIQAPMYDSRAQPLHLYWFIPPPYLIIVSNSLNVTLSTGDSRGSIQDLCSPWDPKPLPQS